MTKRSSKAWTKWRRLIREHARSGQTVTAFCGERGLCRPYFFAWKKRLQKSEGSKFLEVQVKEGASSAVSDSRVEVRLQNGRSLVVGPGFDAAHVRALLMVVEATE
jgi:transposase-like protein